MVPFPPNVPVAARFPRRVPAGKCAAETAKATWATWSASTDALGNGTLWPQSAANHVWPAHRVQHLCTTTATWAIVAALAGIKVKRILGRDLRKGSMVVPAQSS